MNFITSPSTTTTTTGKRRRSKTTATTSDTIDNTKDTLFQFDTHFSLFNQNNHLLSPTSTTTTTSSPFFDLNYHIHSFNNHQLHLQNQSTFMGDSPDSPRDIFPNVFSSSIPQSEEQNSKEQQQYHYDILSHGNISNQYTTATTNSNMISNPSTSSLSYNNPLTEQDVSFTPVERSNLSTTKSKKLSNINMPITSTTTNNNNNTNNNTNVILGKKLKRRKHKNSKLGCATCKDRRVKCSEDLPSCTNCIKHKVKCPYLDYTEAQLNELRQAQYLQQQPSDSEDEIQQPPLQQSQSVPLLSQKKVLKPKVKRSKLTSSKVKTSPPSLAPTNILNVTKHQSITQNFDNLLSQRNEDNVSIVYPVYSYNQKEISTTPSFSNSTSNENPTFQNAFNGALNIPTTFKYKIRKKVDCSIELKRSLKAIAPSIHKGTSGLPEIRNLYSSWLNSFIFKAYSSELMFYCLLNLTTNFLISNCFRHVTKSGQLTPNYSLAHIRLECTQHSLRYYALVIKDLRNVLNDNSDPDLCGSVSYILSLMSIYDPEATLNSSICFRDGLFSIFNHNFKTMKKKAVPLVDTSTNDPQSIPLLPAHQKLMTNIAMSVFLPGYDPSFLNEYQQLLIRFGDLIFPLLRHFKSTFPNNSTTKTANSSSSSTSMSSSSSPNFRQPPNFDFLEIHYQDLLNFTNNLPFFIPQITNNLSDLDKQKDLLFQMLFTWVRMFPSKLISCNKSDPPLIKMLHLFFKLMKKSLFAIFPQVKYFFLRDFDSPLMLDVFATDINGIFEELDDLEPDSTSDDDINYDNRLPPELYVPLINELKSMSSYLIRGINFFERRLSKLYRLLVTHSESLNFNDNSITDINECRQKFQQLVGLKEVYITSFIHQTIKYENYPRVNGDPHYQDDEEQSKTIDDEKRSTSNGIIGDENVDFMTLQLNGLLINDFDPRSGV